MQESNLSHFFGRISIIFLSFNKKKIKKSQTKIGLTFVKKREKDLKENGKRKKTRPARTAAVSN